MKVFINTCMQSAMFSTEDFDFFVRCSCPSSSDIWKFIMKLSSRSGSNPLKVVEVNVKVTVGRKLKIKIKIKSCSGSSSKSNEYIKESASQSVLLGHSNDKHQNYLNIKLFDVRCSNDECQNDKNVKAV